MVENIKVNLLVAHCVSVPKSTTHRIHHKRFVFFFFIFALTHYIMEGYCNFFNIYFVLYLLFSCALWSLEPFRFNMLEFTQSARCCYHTREYNTAISFFINIQFTTYYMLLDSFFLVFLLHFSLLPALRHQHEYKCL